MIESITMKNVASFDNTDTQINDLKRVNFFFGFNGTGKSTIARYLQNISFPQEKQLGEFSNCSQVGYDFSQNQVLTFNDEFIEENFRKSPTQKGVFSLNQANEIIDNQIKAENDLLKKYDNYKKVIEKRKQTIIYDEQLKEKALKDFCWNQRNTFKALVKIQLQYSGSKDNHLLEIKKILQGNMGSILTITQISEQYKNLYETEIKKIEKRVNIYTYKQIRKIETQLNRLLQEVIIGKEDIEIAALIKSLDMRTWVEQGIALSEKTNNICPFCQKPTITEDLKLQFSKYFDETYKRKINQIKMLLSDYQQQANQFISALVEIQNEFNPNNIVSNEYRQLKADFDSNFETIHQKILNSNEKKCIVSINTHKSQLSNIVQKIKEDNIVFEELNTNKKVLVREIWTYMAAGCHDEILKLEQRKVKYQRIELMADNLINKNNMKIAVSRQKIEQLRGKTVTTKEAVDNINIILKNAGFEGFEIKETVISENNISQYYLNRPNKPRDEHVFKKLSEGEKNFVSFLYFYQLCIGTDDILHNSIKKKIIVIDDPVSSLDSQSLFIISTLLHNLILQKGSDNKPNKQTFKNNNIEQVFIFTHNLYFLKEVSLDKRPICTNYNHYSIVKRNNTTTIINNGHDRNAFDEYSLLWQTIRETKTTLPQDTSLNILISNAMRRVIDSYVNFIGYGRDAWGAVATENQNEPSYYIKCAFISAINDDSHKITALDTAYYQKITTVQPQKLFDVFKEIFEKIGKEHYNMMMKESDE
jgi:wobble nucleotide-excising tRNase